MTDPNNAQSPELRPYALVARAYVEAGWLGALPLPAGRKSPVPEGFTGKRFYDIDPTSADVEAWVAQRGNGNIGLRMPRDVVGIDVDAYGDKEGAWTLESAEREWGPLPATWRLTSRTDGISGIRFYRAPEGLAWPNGVGPGIEMVHRGHRYAVAWPSLHPDTGLLYQWIGPDGNVWMNGIPRPSMLPALPDAWVEGLTGGALAGEATERANLKADEAKQAVQAWTTDGAMCSQVEGKLEEALTAVYSRAGGRHDATRDLSLAILYYGQQGHAGVDLAMRQLEEAFVSEVGKDRGTEAARIEFDRFLLGAADIIAARPRPAEECVGHGCGRRLEGLPSDVLPEVVPRSAQEAARRAEEAPGVPQDQEDAFWTSRAVLAHIRTFARARRCSPWALLGVTLVRVTCAVGPAIVIPPLRGGEASLNTFVGLVGPSGSGKGAAEACAREAFMFGAQVEAGVGSGEGLVKSFVRWVPGKKDDPEPGHYDIHTTSVLFRASEVDTLAALKGRSGSTLLPLLRDAWTGDTLGFAYSSEEKRVNLPAHHYRLGLVVGIQPNRAEALLEEADGGTPQRFLWMPSTDPEAPEVAPECPEPWTAWHQPDIRSLARSKGTGRLHLPVCETARRQIDANYLKQARGDTDALDGHSMLARLKVAVGLSLLDNRASVTEEDWTLAGVVMAKSDQTRAAVQWSLSEVKRQAASARAKAEAEKAVTVARRVEEDTNGRIAKRLLSKLSATEWVTLGTLRRGFRSGERGDIEPALEALVEARAVEVQETEYRGRPGRSYRLSGGTR